MPTGTAMSPLAPGARPPGLLLQDVGHPLVALVETESLLAGRLAGGGRGG